MGGDESEAMLKTLHQLATVLSDNEELDASEALFVECVEKRKRVCGEDSQPYLASLSGLAHVYTKKKEHGQALRLMEECLEQRVKGDTCPLVKILLEIQLFYQHPLLPLP